MFAERLRARMRGIAARYARRGRECCHVRSVRSATHPLQKCYAQYEAGGALRRVAACAQSSEVRVSMFARDRCQVIRAQARR